MHVFNVFHLQINVFNIYGLDPPAPVFYAIFADFVRLMDKYAVNKKG